MKDNLFTEFCFLSNLNMNQSQVYIFPLPFEPPSHLPPHSTALGWYRAPVWVSWAVQQIPLGYVFYYGNVSLEKAMAPHSGTLAWKIPWMEEPGRLQSMGSLRVGHDWVTSLSRIGEGNSNPLQCSCLENPRDGGAWWAAVCGVTQSWTRLKWFSSSSSCNLGLPRWLSGKEPTCQCRRYKRPVFPFLPRTQGINRLAKKCFLRP